MLRGISKLFNNRVKITHITPKVMINLHFPLRVCVNLPQPSFSHFDGRKITADRFPNGNYCDLQARESSLRCVH